MYSGMVYTHTGPPLGDLESGSPSRVERCRRDSSSKGGDGLNTRRKQSAHSGVSICVHGKETRGHAKPRGEPR